MPITDNIGFSIHRRLTTFRLILQRQSPRDFFASQRRSLTPEDLPPLLTRRDPQHRKSNHPHENNSVPTAAQQSTQGQLGTGPYVHVDGENSHVAFGRRSPAPLPDPRHSHKHHHDNHRGSKHADDVVVIKGDNDDVHIGRRSPLPDPRHSDHKQHGHGHGNHKGKGGGEKVIIKGDDNNVSVHSRSRITRYQRYSPDRTEVAYEGHQHHVHARKYIPRHQSHHDGSPTDPVESTESPDHADQDRSEKYPRSVLINSVEGEDKYFVPDDYNDQRVTVIEGDGISKILTKVKRGDPGIEGVPGSVEIMVRFRSLSFTCPP